MVRRQQPPQLATLSPEQGIRILETQIANAEVLRTEASDSPRRQEWINTSDGALIAALGEVSTAVDAFHLAQCSVSNMYDGPATRQRRGNRELDDMLAAIRSGVQQLSWKLPEATQHFMPAGSQHDAYVEIRRIVQTASTELMVVDPYVDETLWTLLSNVASSARIRVLTMQMQKDFPLEAKKFVSQHGNQIVIRVASSYHDRFLVIDRGTVWHLGASIKDAGKKAFAMSEFQSSAINKAVITDVEATWAAASAVPI